MSEPRGESVPLCGECGGRLVDHRCADCGTRHDGENGLPIPHDDAARKALFDKAELTCDERVAVEVLMGKRKCSGIVVTPLGGGSRQVGGCHGPVVEIIDGSAYCISHAQEREYQKREFDRMMARSTRHFSGVKFHGKGSHCSCGVFVPEGEVHPWGVPSVVEDRLEDLLKRVPLESYGSAVQEAVAAFRNGSNHPLLDSLAEECQAIDREIRAAESGSQGGSDVTS